jgi:preprotein translocase subunit SecF
MQIFKKPNFKFMKFKFLAFGLSGIIILVGILNFTVGKGINYGVDFTGGTLIRLMFKHPVEISELRNSLGNIGLGASKIQEMGKGHREYIIRTAQVIEGELEQEIEAHEIIGNRVVEALKGEDEKSAAEQGLRDLNSLDKGELTAALQDMFSDQAAEMADKIVSFRVNKGIIEDYTQIQDLGISREAVEHLKEKTYLSRLTVLSKETVGPQIGHDLRRRATQATVWALIGMLIYIGIRFKFGFGISAVITLAHDVLVTITIFAISGREMNLPVIAAILTIVGYSLNDTIVIFDRVRDNIKTLRKHTFQEVLDSSINQTLSRTVITSGTTLLTVLALFLFGGEVISDFAFTMIIGVVVGTYSSIYQSCSWLYFWKKIFKPKKGFGR